MSKISNIDYGMGNILSVKRSFEKCGSDVEVLTNKVSIRKASYLVLPGVVAFKKAMFELEKLDFIDAILEYCKKGMNS